jgi:hypothetical protein
MEWSLFTFNDLRREVIVCLVDIGGIVDHYVLFKLSVHKIEFKIMN